MLRDRESDMQDLHPIAIIAIDKIKKNDEDAKLAQIKPIVYINKP